MNTKMCTSSKRRHYVTIKSPMVNEDDIGTPQIGYVTETETWASIKPIKARERTRHQTTDVIATHLIGLDALIDVDEDYIITWESRTFVVRTVENVDESDFDRICTCTEVKP